MIQSKLHVEDISNMYGKFIFKPLERGMGITLGNCLRRVLLSSIPSCAVTAIKIDGVLHEFSTVHGVKEDVTELILNIKELCLKNQASSDEIKTIYLRVAGEGIVTAGDIQTNSDIEIVNPERVIATLSEGAELNIEMQVKNGVGYVSTEKNKKEDFSIGWIPIDSLYSPVRRVKFAVTDTRVENITDYDQLTLEIWTNGSIEPAEALARASAILNNQLSLIQRELVNSVELPKLDEVFNEESDIDKKLLMPIIDLDLSTRPQNSMRRIKINTVGELIQFTEQDLLGLRNIGKTSIAEIKGKLDAMGLSLKNDNKLV